MKIEDPSERIFLLGGEEYVTDIACGALFTLALTSQQRLFLCGLLGNSPATTIDEQLERTKFREIVIDCRVDKIRAGLSGAMAISREGFAYVWGKFGRTTIHAPKKVQREKKSLTAGEETYVEGRVGDEFAALLTSKGEVLVFGENIDNQLGCESHQLPFSEQWTAVETAPFAKQLQVGRNSVFVVEAEKGELYGWGSNKYGQIFPVERLRGLLPVTNSHFTLTDNDDLLSSSYFTVLLTPKATISLTRELDQSPPP